MKGWRHSAPIIFWVHITWRQRWEIAWRKSGLGFKVTSWPSLSFLRDVRVWIWRHFLCAESSCAHSCLQQQPNVSNPPCQIWEIWKLCKMCVSVHIFQKAYGPIILRQRIRVWPNFYVGLPLSTACPMQNDSSQIPILSPKNVPMCAWVRPSSPYYRVRIGVCWGHRQAVSDVFSVLQLLHRLSTDLNEIGHGQSVGDREHGRGVGILKFGTVAMEIWKCGLWGPVWPWRLRFWSQDLLKSESYWPTIFLPTSELLSYFQFLWKQ